MSDEKKIYEGREVPIGEDRYVMVRREEGNPAADFEYAWTSGAVHSHVQLSVEAAIASAMITLSFLPESYRKAAYERIEELEAAETSDQQHTDVDCAMCAEYDVVEEFKVGYADDE